MILKSFQPQHPSLYYTYFMHDCDIIFWLMSLKIREYISAFSREICGMTSTGSLLSDPLDVWSSPSSFPFLTDLFGDKRDCGFGLFLEPFGRPLFRFIGMPSSSSWTGCKEKVFCSIRHLYQSVISLRHFTVVYLVATSLI